MADLTLRLEIDPITGKKNIIVHYESDQDALPMEHEDAHRQLVDALVEGGALAAADVGELIIERGATAPTGVEEAAPSGSLAGEKEQA